MRRILLSILALTISAAACGKERWPVKTLSDHDANKVAADVKTTTVHELLLLKAPSERELKKATSRRFPAELVTYRVRALLIGYKKEADEDYHLVLRDPDSKETMIAEIPAPHCIKNPNVSLLLAVHQARLVLLVIGAAGRYRLLDPPEMVEVTGVAFFDFLHGQTGVAPNGIELHPVTMFTLVPH